MYWFGVKFWEFMAKQRSYASEEVSSNRPIAVDLFAGAGGMTLGFEQAGFNVLAAVEIDPIHACTHQYNFPFWTILCQSVTETTGEEIRAKSAIKNRDIDVVFGGPPCQGFSIMGKRIVDDPRNSLMFHFVRLVLELKPKFFVMENVRGLTIGKAQQLLIEIIKKFQANNYQVQEDYQILNAACFGVPQHRERLFLIGARADYALPAYPQPITKPIGRGVTPCRTGQSNLRKKKGSYLFNEKPSQCYLLPSPNVRDALQDLPVIENYPELFDQDWVWAEFKEPSFYGATLRGLIRPKTDYSYERENFFLKLNSSNSPSNDKLSQSNYTLLTSSLRTRHTPRSISRFAATNPGKKEPISRFFRLHYDGICNTLRAGTPSNKGAFTSPRPIHPEQPRCITVREAARLHSYPDWFRFHSTKWHGFRQIGNSVPPLLAQAVATEIVKVLDLSLAPPTKKQNLGSESLLYLNFSEATRYYHLPAKTREELARKITSEKT
jgi:DNA (cytosine-5)-methyltransferase 1